MDTGLTVTPVLGPVAGGSQRPAQDPATPVSGAEASAANSVPTAPDSHATREASRAAQPHAAGVAQRFTIDPQTRELIYQFVDTSTGKVIQQVPGQALLRSQAYSNALRNGATPLEAEIHADFET